MEEIPTIQYIAANNLSGVNSVLKKYSFPSAHNTSDGVEAMEILLDEVGDNAAYDIVSQHPDYDMIVEHSTKNSEKNAIGEAQNTAPIIQSSSFEGTRKVDTASQEIFSTTVKDVMLVVMAFWLLNKIIGQ
jgi:hypothetical protein